MTIDMLVGVVLGVVVAGPIGWWLSAHAPEDPVITRYIDSEVLAEERRLAYFTWQRGDPELLRPDSCRVIRGAEFLADTPTARAAWDAVADRKAAAQRRPRPLREVV